MKYLSGWLFIGLWLFSTTASSFSEPCQLVAQMAGNKEYQQKPMRVASMKPLHAIPEVFGLRHLESHGAWHIYQTPQPWMLKEQCAPFRKSAFGQTIWFSPVVLNKRTGHNAVITGSFIIKIYRKQHWNRVARKYGLTMLSPLPNPKSFIVDVKPTSSYDLLIKGLDLDKDVALGLPLLSEPRPRR